MNTKTTNNLRLYRLKAGLRQIDVARILGKDFTDRLSRWENGLAMPNITNLFRLAEIYKVPPEQLYLDLRQSVEKEIKLEDGRLSDIAIAGNLEQLNPCHLSNDLL